MERLLADDQRRALRHLAAPPGGRGGGQLVQLAGHVHDAGAAWLGGGPRHRARERVVDLERRGAVAPAREPALQPPGQRVGGQQPGEHARADRGEDRVGADLLAAGQADAGHAAAADQDLLDARLAAQLRSVGGGAPRQRVHQRLHAGARQRPAVALAHQLQQEAERSAAARGRRQARRAAPTPRSRRSPARRRRTRPCRAARSTRGTASAQRGVAPRSARTSRSASRPGGSGARIAAASWSACGSIRSIAAAQPAPAGPSEAAVAAASRCSASALPSSNGCAITTGGSIQSTSSSSSRIAGLMTAIGANAAQRSWTNPGSVSSPDDVAPPGVAACSSTVTSSPAAARWIAATRPVCPAPTTRTWVTRSPSPHRSSVHTPRNLDLGRAVFLTSRRTFDA